MGRGLRNQALQRLVIAVGRFVVELPGELAGNALSQKARAYLSSRLAADPDSLWDHTVDDPRHV